MNTIFSQRIFKLHPLQLLVSLFLSWYFLFQILPSAHLETWSFVDSFDLVIHEAGHTLSLFFGQFIRTLAGSGLQILVPIVCSGYFFLRKEYFSGSILLLWVGHNILNIAVYMSDAIAQELPLLGGDAVIHDWNYILSTLHILPYTGVISSAVWVIGLICAITGAVLSLYISCTTDKGKVV